MQDIRDVQTWNLNRKEREDRKDRTKDFLTFGKKEILVVFFASSRFNKGIDGGRTDH
jgi:hypothetical protein